MNAVNGDPAIGAGIHAIADRFVDAERETLVGLCRRLVEAPSVNPPGDTRAAAAVEGVRWERIKGWDPNWTVPGEAVARAVGAAAARVRGAAPAPVVRLPASDGSRWRARGLPAICYGPQRELASGVDDYAVEQDVVDCAKVYAGAAVAYLNAVD